MASLNWSQYPAVASGPSKLSGAWVFKGTRLNMTVPNAERAVVAAEKATEYLLNMSHKRGAAKARLLVGVGYGPDTPRLLESDLRAQHLSVDVTRTSGNAYGVVYEIEGPIKTPSGKTIRFCSIWQIDAGTDVPRFITMDPR
jgi:hypothetical protein